PDTALARPGNAQATADHPRTKLRVRQHTSVYIVRKSALQREAVHLGEFVRFDCIDLLAKERRQSKEVMQIAEAEKVVLVAIELIRAVSAQPQRPAQEKLRNRTGIARTKCRATLGGHENRSRPGDWLKILNLAFHRGKAFERTGTGVVPPESCFCGVATPRNDGVGPEVD